jgi:hypothetical protein
VFLAHEEKSSFDVFKCQMLVLSRKVQIIEEVLQVLVKLFQAEDFASVPEVFEGDLSRL